ncbi:MAG: helix-turn-helix domain-containing protein [Bacteroidales bacterium]|nr:helix-turn-helix domain-containing protein [Bacteroidales bacterium]
MNSATKITFLIVAAALFIYSGSSAAQETVSISTSRYDISNGLPVNEVNCIRQDADGFLWLATRSGIVRYDGYDFTQFKSTIDNPEFLINNEVREIDIAGDKIAMSHTNGVDIFNLKTQHTFPIADSLISGRNFRAVLWADDNTLLIGGSSGLFGFDTRNKNVHQLVFVDESGENILKNVRSLFKDSSSNIWISTWKRGVFLIQAGSGEVKHLTGVLPSNLFSTSVADDGTRIYIGTWNDGLYILEGGTGGFTSAHVNLGKWGCHIIYALSHDSHGRLWVAHSSGVLMLTQGKDGPEPASIEDNEGLQQLKNLGEVKAALCDRSGNIWLSDQGNGVMRVRYMPTSIQETDFRDYGFSSSSVSAIYKDRDGIIWAGVYGHNVIRFDPEKKIILPQHPLLKGLNEDVNSIMRFVPLPKKDQLVMASRYDGVYVLEMDNGEPSSISHYDIKMNGIRNKFTFDAAADASGNIWVATSKGLVLLRGVLDSYVPEEPADLNNAIGYGDVTTLLCDRKGYLWISTQDKGIFRVRYDLLNNCLTECTAFPPGSQVFPGKRVNCLIESSADTLWAGDNEYGLLRYNPSAQAFEAAPKSASLPSQSICSICEGSSGVLWISTDAGIARYESSPDPIVGSVSPLSGDLHNFTFMPGSCWSNGHEIIFGGYGGMTTVFPDRMRRNPSPLKPFITDIRILGRSVSGLSLMPPYTKEIVVRSKERSLSLSFACTDFGESGGVLYAYRLDNPDRDWTFTGANERSVIYSNLRPGTYTFRVKAISTSGERSGEASLRIKVKPSPWASWWSILGYLIILGVLVTLLIITKSKKESLEKDLESFRGELARQTYPDTGNSLDKKFIDKAVKIIEDHLSDPDFDIDEFNSAMSMSNSTLYRKMKSLTGRAPKEFIRSIRFKYACRFLLEKTSNVSEVAYLVGFSNAKYFSQSFKKEFGKTPSQYIRDHKIITNQEYED